MSISKTYIESSAVLAQLLGTPAAVSKIVASLTAEGWAPGGGGGVTLTQVNNAVNAAIAGLSTTGYVDSSIQTAINALPAGVTNTQMNTAIQNAINSLPAGVTTTQMNNAISTALANSGLQTSTQVGSAISSAITNLVTTTQMSSAISAATTNLVTTTQLNTAISGVSGGGVSTAYVDNAISTALAGLPAYATMTQVNTAIQSALADVLHRPGAVSDSALGADTLSTIGGNVLTNDTDPNGGTLSVTGISYSAAIKTVGTSFTTTYGTFTISSAGVWLFTLGTAARALAVGQTGTEVFTYTVTSSAGSSNATTLTLTITGTNNAPVVTNDTGSLPFNTTGTGNVLTNDSDPEGTALTVTSFSIATLSAPFTLGTAKTVTGMGTFTLSSNGAWTFVPVTDWSGSVPTITYVASDGVNTTSGTLSLSVSPAAPTATSTQTWYASYATLTPSSPTTNPPPARAAADFTRVVSTYPNWDWTCPLPARNGDLSASKDFEVGPGKAYTNIGDVPWQSLLPGDRVFIYYRNTPYKEFIYLPVRGESDRWIEIIGVPGPNGELPVLDGQNAVASTSFNWPPDHQGLGLILVTPMASGITYGFKPGYIHIHGLKFINVRAGNNYTSSGGATTAWGSFSAAIAAHGVDHLTISGCQMSNCALGVFVNSTQAERVQSRNIHLLYNYIYGAGNLNAASEHNCYIEAIGTIYEFNYFDSLLNNSWGQFIKDRSAGIIYRYNFMHNSNTCSYMLGMPDPDSSGGYSNLAVDSYGDSLMKNVFIYGNTFVLDQPSANMYEGWPSAIIEHGGGGAYPAFPQYRYGSLHVYNNVFVSKVDATTVSIGGSTVSGSVGLFVLANIRAVTTAYVKNNLFYGTSRTSGPAPEPWALFGCQGPGDFQQNWITTFQNSSTTVSDGAYNQGTHYNGTGLNGLTASTADPGFRGFSVGDYALTLSSPYYSLTAPLHADATARGLTVQTSSVITPFGVPPKPSIIVLPSVTPANSSSVVAGVTLTAVDGTWAYGVNSSTRSWTLDGTVVGTSTSYTPQSADTGKVLVYSQTATNDNGSTTASSVGYTIISATQPANTSLPYIQGVAMVGTPISVNNGTWINSPTSYTYEFLILGSVVATGTYTPVTGDVGKVISVRVTAIKGSESGVATSAGVTISALSYDPDATGTWNFTKADATYLDTIDVRFQGAPANYAVYSNMLRSVTAYGGPVYYSNGQGNDQSVGAVANKITGTYGALSLYLQANSSQNGYEVAFLSNRFEVWYLGSLVQSVTHGMNTATATTLKVTLVGGVMNVYMNGSNLWTHTFTTPDTGGFPGWKIQTPGGAVTDVIMDSWTDNPA